MSDDTIKIERPTSPKLVPDVVRLSMQNQSQPQQQPEKASYSSEPITLPSQGYFYNEDNPLSKGFVDVKYMTAREEDILVSQNLIKKGIVLERLLESVIVTPGVKVNDLLIGDKNALYFACRRLAYGDSYGPVDVTCSKCNVVNKTTIDFSQIKNKDIDYSSIPKGTNSFEFVMPFSKRVVKYKILTHKDETEIDKDLESLNKVSKSGKSFDITTRLKKMILSVDESSDRAVVNKFVDEMSTRDSQSFRKHMKDFTPDVDATFEFVCDSCGHTERIGIPITVNFFWP